MAKVLEATCVGGVVKVGTLPIPETVIYSQGVGASSGLLFLDGDKRYYAPDDSGDLKTTLEQLSSALTQIAAALTIVDAKPIGTLPAAPGAAANIAAITAAKAALDALLQVLK